VTYRRAIEGLAVAFEYSLEGNTPSSDYLLFAFVHPFSLTDI